MLPIIKRFTLSFLRDKSLIFINLTFPLLMIFILGNMLSGMDESDPEIGAIKIAYSIETADPTETQAVKAFIGELDRNKSLKLSLLKDASESAGAIESGKIDAAFAFTRPLAITIEEGKDPIKNRAVKMIATGFARYWGSVKATGLPPAKDENSTDPFGDPVPRTADTDLGYNRSMMDYYAVAMIITMAFMMGGGITGATDIYENRGNGTLRRLLSSPKSRNSIYLQTLAAGYPQNILQVAIVMSASTIFFGAHYAATWQLNLLLLLLFVALMAAVSSIYLIIGLLVKVVPVPPIIAITWAMLFLSGSFAKQIYIPQITPWLPTRIAQDAAFGLTVFGRTGDAWRVIAVSAIVTMVAGVIGSALFKRKELTR